MNPSSSKYAYIARPYAIAAFLYAREKKHLPRWKTFLEAASLVTSDERITQILANPEVTSGKLFELFNGVLTSILDAEQKNFLLLLAQNKRLGMLPEIAVLFNAYYLALEKSSRVRVITATKMEENFQKKLTEALTKRIKQDVTLQCDIDPAILGGAVIHIGDRVIDGSIRGKLTRLLKNLTD